MQKITHESIQHLLETEANPKVTLYIPLEAGASPPHISENQIRFKNLIHKAVDELKAMGDTSKLSSELCAKLDEVHDNLEFWKDKKRGILLLAAPGMMETFDLPIDTEEYAAVDDTFHLAPILALLADDRAYYVLSLAQQNPKLYKGDMYGLTPMDIGLPSNIRTALGIDEPNQKTENQGSAIGTSMKTGWFNGRGGAGDPQDIDRVRFFHTIDKLLLENLDRNVPLILAGIEAETVEFRDLSKYPKILEETISGNHTDTRPEELFTMAHDIITHELIQPEHDAAREEYERLQGANPERVARDKKSITEAAEQGRVDKLLAQMSRRTTDTVQDAVKPVLRITFPEGDFSKTLNGLAMQVWQMSGKVVNLMPHEMPNGALMVARLRY